MKTENLKDLLKRIEHWPEDARAEALDSLRAIEEDLVVGPELLRELEEAHQQALLGEGISHDELKEQLGLNDE